MGEGVKDFFLKRGHPKCQGNASLDFENVEWQRSRRFELTAGDGGIGGKDRIGRFFWAKVLQVRERKGGMGEREGKQSERKEIGKFNWDDESGEVVER